MRDRACRLQEAPPRGHRGDQEQLEAGISIQNNTEREPLGQGTSQSFVSGILHQRGITLSKIIGASGSLAPDRTLAMVGCALVKPCAGLSKSGSLKRLSSSIRKCYLQRKDSLFTHMRLRVSLGLHSYSMTEKGLPHWQ